jgi:hypothetical protein
VHHLRHLCLKFPISICILACHPCLQVAVMRFRTGLRSGGRYLSVRFRLSCWLGGMCAGGGREIGAWRSSSSGYAWWRHVARTGLFLEMSVRFVPQY